MEFTVKRNTVLCFGFSAILSFSLFTLGCSSDNSQTAQPDAGKKDSGTGGSGGSGGSSATGGTSGSGGSSASGGSSGSGGSSSSGGSGGSNASGGTSSSGGSSASGGSGGSGGSSSAGGSGGRGGSGGTSAGGTGGTTAGDAGVTQIDGSGGVDAGTSDAEDAPLSGPDGGVLEAGASNDGGAPALVDTGAHDTESVDSQTIDSPAIDTVVALLDAEIDTAADLPGIDSQADPFACPSVTILTGGDTHSIGATTGSFCFATCDSITGWGASNLEGRQVKVNGEIMTVPASGGTGGQMPLATKVLGTYNLFQVTAGTTASAAIDWWGTFQGTCPSPDGGFFP
jgi:hypothetical protein